MYEFSVNRNYKKVRFKQDQEGEFVSIIEGDGFENVPYLGTMDVSNAKQLHHEGKGDFTAFWSMPLYYANNSSAPEFTDSSNTLIAFRTPSGVYIILNKKELLLVSRENIFNQLSDLEF